MKIQKYHYVIAESEILSIVEDTCWWDDLCCDHDGYSTTLDLEFFEEMKEDIVDEDKLKKIDKAIKLIHKLAEKDGCKPNKINLIVNRQ